MDKSLLLFSPSRSLIPWNEIKKLKNFRRHWLDGQNLGSPTINYYERLDFHFVSKNSIFGEKKFYLYFIPKRRSQKVFGDKNWILSQKLIFRDEIGQNQSNLLEWLFFSETKTFHLKNTFKWKTIGSNWLLPFERNKYSFEQMTRFDSVRADLVFE